MAVKSEAEEDKRATADLESRDRIWRDSHRSDPRNKFGLFHAEYLGVLPHIQNIFYSSVTYPTVHPTQKIWLSQRRHSVKWYRAQPSCFAPACPLIC